MWSYLKYTFKFWKPLWILLGAVESYNNGLECHWSSFSLIAGSSEVFDKAFLKHINTNSFVCINWCHILLSVICCERRFNWSESRKPLLWLASCWWTIKLSCAAVQGMQIADAYHPHLVQYVFSFFFSNWLLPLYVVRNWHLRIMWSKNN